jgi:hypothetical protein
MTMSLGLHLGLGHHRGSSGGGSPANAVNTVAPSITGTRGGTLTATPGTWTGATSVSGQWYADGVATGNTTTSFTDSDTSKTLEYRVTALPGSVVAKAFKGALVTGAAYSDNFDGYADGTRLAARYNSGTVSNFIATASPNVAGWDLVGDPGTGTDTDTTGAAQNLRIYNGKVQRTYNSSTNAAAIVHDFGSTSGTYEYTLALDTATTNRALWFSVSNTISALTNWIQVRIINQNQIRLETKSWDVANGIWANISLGRTIADGETLKVKLDATAKKVYLFLSGAAVGDAAGYDLSTWSGTWTSKAGFPTNESGMAAGTNLVSALVYDTLDAVAVTSALINAQPSGIPGKKQVDFSASIGVAGATGAQYKIETEAGEFVQGWTAATFSSGTASGSFLIPDFAYEGQKLNVLVRNVGGTVKTASALTPANGYALQQQHRIGLNDAYDTYWGNQIPGRDYFQSETHADVAVCALTTSDRHGIIPVGQNFSPNWMHWDQVYSPTQSYPATTGSEDYRVCVYNGVQWRRTDTTARSGVAPDPADPSGTTSGWQRFGWAHGSVVGMQASGWPSKLPDDPNATIIYFPPWTAPTARYPFTVHCKTEPGVKFNLSEPFGKMTMLNQNVPAGTFDLYVTGDHNGQLKIDRSTPISSAFFLSGIPDYETGTPSADIGSPYVGIDKKADFAPFYGRRDIHGYQVVELFVTTPVGGWLGANVPAGGFREWKYNAALANECGHKAIWLNIPDFADDSYIAKMGAFYASNLNTSVAEVLVEVGNERWNSGYSNTAFLNARAAALDPADPCYNKPYLLHARETAAAVAKFKAAFGAVADASRVKGVLAWQTAAWQGGTAVQTWTAMLNVDGNAYQNVSYISTAPYMNVDGSGKDIGSYTNTPQNIRDAVAANDQTAFNAAADAQMRSALNYEVSITKTLYDFLGGYSVSKGLNKNAIGYASYEASQHIIVAEANWDSGLGAGMGARASAMTTAYKKSATYATTHALYIDTMASKCPHLMMMFDYVGNQVGDTWWAHLTRTGNQTDEPYATIKTKALAYN